MAASAILLRPVPITPPTYHRIVSPALRVPEDKSLPIPVGLLACQRDPLLRELTSTVISCSAYQPATSESPAGNRKKKGSGSAASDRDTLFEVILHDTVLFPEGGGQPSDIGTIRTSNGEEYEVAEVKRRGGHAIHFVKSKNGSAVGLEVGLEVTTALGEAGFMRRLDHMCMHTSQHLLSALLETQLDLPTLSWALTTYPSPSYVELPRSLSLDEIAQIQSLAHTLAYEGRSVHVEVEPLEEDNRPGVATLEGGRTVGKALPQDYTGGVKRTVVIDGVDRNPCCGTHLPSLHNLQLFLLPQTESLARGSTSTSRLFFLCGPRLHAHLASSHNLLTSTAGIMSCGPALVPERVQQVVEERKRADKRAEDLESELARVIARSLHDEAHGRVVDSTEAQGRPFVKYYHRSDDPASALGILQAISSNYVSISSGTETASPVRSYIIVLTSSPTVQTSTSISTVLLLSSDEKLVKTVGDALKSKLSVKGGGKGIRWSGKWSGVWKDAKEGSIVEQILADL